jgi:hypothetical protein
MLNVSGSYKKTAQENPALVEKKRTENLFSFFATGAPGEKAEAHEGGTRGVVNRDLFPQVSNTAAQRTASHSYLTAAPCFAKIFESGSGGFFSGIPHPHLLGFRYRMFLFSAKSVTEPPWDLDFHLALKFSIRGHR